MLAMRRFIAPAGPARRMNNGIQPSPVSPNHWSRSGSRSKGVVSSMLSSPAGATARRSKGIERSAVAIMLFIAWAWIMVFCGMIFYHGYQYRVTSGGRGAGDAAAAAVHGVDPLELEAEGQRIQADAITTTAAAVKVNQMDAPRGIGQESLSLSSLEPHGSPLIVFTCQRANYLRDTLTDILKYIPSDCSIGCPVVISQDGKDAAVSQVIAEFAQTFMERKGVSVKHLEHKSALRRGQKSTNSYQALSVHYGWALREVFDGRATASPTARLPQRVLILEEDLHIAPDFFGYMHAMAPILDADESLLAVSAFNDNGFQDTVSDANRVLRSDFFPGLGWMMTRKLWTNELQSKWPNGYWDDWLREPVQRQGRHILRPEVSRTFHFGVSGGASNNQFGSALQKVSLNHEKIDWKVSESTSSEKPESHWSTYLQNQPTYDQFYMKLMNSATLESSVQEALKAVENGDVRVEYSSYADFQTLARELHLMTDEKAGIPRTAYKGVVETRPRGKFIVFLTPPMSELRKTFSSSKTIAVPG